MGAEMFLIGGEEGDCLFFWGGEEFENIEKW